MGIFADWQPQYAAHGVATFPVNIDDHGKRPAVRGYLKAGRRASNAWVSKFGDSNALGFAVRPNRITVLDVDSPDENIFADALAKHGQSPVVVRSQSGNYQAYYRNNAEGRHVRPWPELPIDVLGDGFAVAPPSEGVKGRYELIQGCLDDLADLPILGGWAGREAASNDVTPPDRSVSHGRRNNDLFKYAMKAAHGCDSQSELLARARTYAARTYRPALPDDEIQRGVASAWRYTIEGNNYLGERHVVLTHKEIDALAVTAPDALLLLSILRRNHWGGSTFLIADAMAEHGVVPLTIPRLRRARTHLLKSGYIDQIRRPSAKYGAALYCWAT